MLSKLLKNEALKISQTYKISAKEAESILEQKLKIAPSFVKYNNPKDIIRSRDYKNFIKSVKKDIYYSIRTYRKNTNNTLQLLENLKIKAKNNQDFSDEITNLLNTHVSTKERTAYIKDFIALINEFCDKNTNITDLGGGLFPLSLPLNFYIQIKNFTWIDKDKKSFEILSHFKNILNVTNLHLINENLETYTFDKESSLVLMFKLIPVIWRQNRSLFWKLTKINAKTIILTGSCESMTKKINIKKREDAVLKKFITNSNSRILKTFTFGDEFGYVLVK